MKKNIKVLDDKIRVIETMKTMRLNAKIDSLSHHEKFSSPKTGPVRVGFTVCGHPLG